jgi:UDP-N-acetylmuramate--alanine ligase
LSRSGAEIGRGLAAARETRPIVPGERIHVVGASGAGASAALLLAHYAGAGATGCDPGGSSPYTQAPEALNIPLSWRHDAGHVAHRGHVLVDRLAVTKALTAVDPDHPELRLAREHGLPVEPWHQVVADAAATQGGKLVAVAGTHGKSTTSGWLVHLLVHARRDPAAFVGALLGADLTGGTPATARWGRGDVFVVEADEYAGNFDPFRPSLAVLLNAEWDHPDVFADELAVIAAFQTWLEAAARTGDRPTLVANAGNPGVASVLARLATWPGEVLAVALDGGSGASAQGGSAGNQIPPPPVLAGRPALLGRLSRSDGKQLITFADVPPPTLALPDSLTVALPGRHNAENALCVAVAAAVLGVAPQAVREGLATFRGVGRRMELKGDAAGETVLDDYGHHPSAIAATLAAVRQRYPGRPVWAVYEPLTYHRTAAMLDAFADVLSTADRVVIAEIWRGRDPDTSITSATRLADAVRARRRAPAEAPGSVESTADFLAEEVKPGDVVLVMGGGRSYVIAERLVAALRAAEEAGRDRRAPDVPAPRVD